MIKISEKHEIYDFGVKKMEAVIQFIRKIFINRQL
jgi:hypothetical protein